MFNSLSQFVTVVCLMVLSNSVLFAQFPFLRTNYVVGPWPYTIVAADFDGDGNLDLATAPNVAYNADGIGWVTVLLNNGNGTFATPDSIRVGDAPSLAAADLDTNGTVDLVAADYFTHRIYVLLNDGTGSFTVTDSFPSGGYNAHILCAADLDGNGTFDLAVPNSDELNPGDSLSIFFNNGNATFTGPVRYATGDYPHTAISADLDLDGDSDLVVTNNGSASVSVFLNDGTGSFAPRVNYAVRLFPQFPSLADYNGDGCLDLAVPNAGPSTPYVSVLMGNCDGTFDPRVDWAGCRPHTVASADYDMDGDIDMAVTNNECNSVSIFLNNGNGTFALDFTLPAGIGTQHIVAKDFDCDGDIDLAASNFGHFGGAPGNNVSVFMNLSVRVLSPDDSATIAADTVSFTWRDARPAVDRYQFQLALDSLFSSLVTNDSTLVDTAATQRQLINGQRYWWRVRAHYVTGWGPFSSARWFRVIISSVREIPGNLPTAFSLEQNYPNPFNPTTIIRFSIPVGTYGRTSLRVYNLLGQEVATLVNEELKPGSYEATWDANDMASGVYLYRLTSGTFTETRRMLLLK